MNKVMVRNNRYKAEQSVEKARARVQEAAHAVQAIRKARHFTEEHASGRLDVSSSMNREYHRTAVHRFENGTRLEDLTPEQVGAAAGVSSQGGGR
jgi:hypothetical protein